MYSYTNRIILLYGIYSFHNPILSIEDSCVYFKPQKRHINREGLIYSEIKYATHFITRKDGKQRCCDGSKIRNYHLIKFVLENADIKHDFIECGESKCYFVKRIDRNNNIIVSCLNNQIERNYYKILTFMPNQTETQVLKKTTPMR